MNVPTSVQVCLEVNIPLPKSVQVCSEVNVCARTKQTEQTIEIFALAIAFEFTNVPPSSERTWTLFHHPLIIDCDMESSRESN